ncbi:hypothetical protein [Saccharomonospora azurea]|nr:hypothetical protein [Saccharomonospora azurea]
MRRFRARPAAMAGLATAAALVLPACGGGADADLASADVPDDAFQAEADLAGVTSRSIDASFSDVDDSDDARVLAPGVELSITGIAQLDTITADLYADLTGSSPGTTDTGEPIEAVHPAEGQTFYAVEYTSDDPQWEPRGEIPDSEVSVAIDGNAVFEVFDTSEGTMHRGTIVVSVPEDRGPDSAVLEVETDGKFQSLSLIDGHRVASDVDHIYETVGHGVDVTSAEEFEETFTGWTGDTQRMAGSVESAFVTPWLHRGDGGDGWADASNVYLSVEMSWAEFSATSFDESTMHLTLDNGKTVRPDNDPSGLRSAFQSNAVFQIPADTESVTVVVEPQVKVGAGNSAKVHDWEPFTAELTVTT